MLLTNKLRLGFKKKKTTFYLFFFSSGKMPASFFLYKNVKTRKK